MATGADSSEILNKLFFVISDPTRRDILSLLRESEELKVSDVAKAFDMSLNGVSKHIKIMERANIVKRRIDWRTHYISPNWESLQVGYEYLHTYQNFWGTRLEAFVEYININKRDLTMTTLNLQIVRTVKATQQAAFEAWLNPEALKLFMCPGPGMTVPHAENSPEVGGSFLIVMKAGDQEMPHKGKYKVIEKYSRLEFSWISPFQKNIDSLVTIEFKKHGEDQTEVILSHKGFDSEESRGNHEKGWAVILEKFENALK
ncbi:MAG: metalloregulator ArsR/SmtB family transcription factor [Oligoflexales bacterium]